MRLQQFFSAAGVCSRRKSEELIQSGRVLVNGQTAALGMRVCPETDRVTLDGEPVRLPKERTYIMLHKPRGIVSTLSDEKGRRTVANLVKGAGVRLYPVGRLDMDSEGLLLLTDDGEAANRLAHPSHGVEKTYHVWVEGADIERGCARLQTPLSDGAVRYRPAKVRLLSNWEGERAVLSVTIGEGKNRQVRKMCELAGLCVTRLVRVSEGELRLGNLPCGKWRYLSDRERRYLQQRAKR
jgi:23S rRNA pseudouridine2605 synthase